MNDINTTQSQKVESTLDWIASNRLHEEYIFFYGLILSGWTALGYYTFGFELSGWTQVENLAVNFLWMLLIGLMMYFAPFWYRLTFGRRSSLQKRTEKIENKIEMMLYGIDDEAERERIYQYYEDNGHTAPSRLAVFALIVLFWMMLFELFFINAWVKGDEYQLVWKPDWANSAIDWIKGNTALPPLGKHSPFFTLKFDDTIFQSQFPDEQAFLTTDFADSALLFHFWRVIKFIPTLVMMGILLWTPFEWLGMKQISARYVTSFWRLIWSGIATFFMLLLTMGLIIMFLMNITYSMRYMLSNDAWLGSLSYMVGYCFILWTLILVAGWGYFWQRVFRWVKGKLSTSEAVS